MKIVVPVDENKLESSVCFSFGRAPYFLIYDTEAKTGRFLSNAAAASQGGAGIKAAQAVVDSGATALLTPRCGENAAAVLKAADVKLYQTAAGSAMENVTAFLAGKLPPLGEIHAGFHGRGGR
ncbi:MAG TPA: NifB/NifX family molybdenum-iron cluster-binding protein [Oscillospiraceae bacterium]|nr:NifB/NifX family molybdenum-iron cluster-binding protein [Oscillospiraceae bacterium]